MKIDLCSGTAAPIRKAAGYSTIDGRPFPGVDHVLWLGRDRLPFADNAVDEIRAADALEHIETGFFELMDECWRVLKPGGIFDIAVPRFPTANAIMHPDHYRFFLSEEDARPFAAALLALTEGRVKRLFCVHSWAMFLPPADGVDVHGYFKHFWDIVWQAESDPPTHLAVHLTPNKPGGRFPYKPVNASH